MQLLKNAPLAFSCIISIVFMWLSAYISEYACILAIILSVSFAIIFAVILGIQYRKNNNRLKDIFKYIVLTLIMISILLTGSFSFFQKDLRQAGSFNDQDVTVIGKVEEIRYNYAYFSSIIVKVTEINGCETDLKAVVEFDCTSPIDENDTFTLNGRASLFNDEEKYLLADGCVMKITAEETWSATVHGKSHEKWSSVFLKINKYFQNILDTHTSPKTADLVGAMLLGNRENLDEDVIRDFRRAGISHMLALSGLHVGIIIGFCDFILRKLRMSKGIRCIFLVISAILYLFLTGLSLSAARSVIMISFVYISYLFYADADNVTSLFVSAFLVFAISPSALFDVGFWMSFFATLGIIVASQILSPLNYKLKKKHFLIQLSVHLLSAISITVAASVATSAFSWLIFEEISIISVLSNLIFSLPASLILSLGLILIITSWMPIAPGIISFMLNILANFFCDTASTLSHLKNIVISMRYDFIKYIVPVMLAVIIVLVLIKLNHKWLTALPVAGGVIAFIICLNVFNNSNAGLAEITYIKNNRAEMITIVNNDGASICDISTGGYSHFEEAYEEILNGYATEVENLILTHYHQFHPTSIFRMCKRYMIRKIYLPEPDNDKSKEYYEFIVDSLKETDVIIIDYVPGDTLDLGGNYTVTISDYLYIDRSTHPMYSITVTDNSDKITYLTSSIYDSEDFSPQRINTSFYIFGSHGPNIHNAPDYSKYDFSNIDKIIISDAEKQGSEDLLEKEHIRIMNYKDKEKIILGNK